MSQSAHFIAKDTETQKGEMAIRFYLCDSDKARIQESWLSIQCSFCVPWQIVAELMNVDLTHFMNPVFFQ